MLDPTTSFTPLSFWLKHVLFDANTIDSHTRTCTDISKNKCRSMSSSNCITRGCKNVHAWYNWYSELLFVPTELAQRVNFERKAWKSEEILYRDSCRVKYKYLGNSFNSSYYIKKQKFYDTPISRISGKKNFLFYWQKENSSIYTPSSSSSP